MHAELAYVFRHALLRAAAYELQLPEDRARLHALALHALELALADAPDALNAAARELADHAALGTATEPALAAREVHWLLRAARHAQAGYRHDAEAECLQRLVSHAAATPARQREALEDLANCRSRAGRPLQALAHFEGLLAIGRRDGDPGVELAALNGMGQALRQLGRLAESGTVLLQAVERARATGRIDRLAVAAGMLGVLREYEGRTDEAARWYEQSLAAARAAGDRKSEELALGNHANLHLVLRRHDQAMQIYQQALQIAVERGDLRTQAIWTGNIALVHGRLLRHELAEQMIAQCLELARRSGDRRTEAAMLINLSSHLLESRRWQECRAGAQAALEAGRELQNPAFECGALGILGRVEFDQGRADAAEPLLAQALEAARRARNPREIGKAMGYHAGALKALGQRELARHRLAEAGALSHGAGDHESAAGWFAELAILCREGSDEAAAAQAWGQAQDALMRLGDTAITQRLTARFEAARP